MTQDDLALRLAKPFDSFDGTGSVQAVTQTEPAKVQAVRAVVPRPSGNTAAMHYAQTTSAASQIRANGPSSHWRAA